MTDRISFINMGVRPKNKTIVYDDISYFIPSLGCGLDRASNSVDVETPVTCQMMGSPTPNFTSRLVKVAQEDDTFCIAGTSTSGDFMYVNTNTTPKTVRCNIPYPERIEDMTDLPVRVESTTVMGVNHTV